MTIKGNRPLLFLVSLVLLDVGPTAAKVGSPRFSAVFVKGYVRLLRKDLLSSPRPMDQVPADAKAISLGKGSSCLLLTESWRAFELRGVATIPLESNGVATENSGLRPYEIKLNLENVAKLSDSIETKAKSSYRNSKIVSMKSGKAWLSIPQPEQWDPHASSVAVCRAKTKGEKKWSPFATPCHATEDGPWLELDISENQWASWEPLWIGYPEKSSPPTYLVHVLQPNEMTELSRLEADKRTQGQMLFFYVCSKIHYWGGARKALNALRGQIIDSDWTRLKANLKREEQA